MGFGVTGCTDAPTGTLSFTSDNVCYDADDRENMCVPIGEGQVAYLEKVERDSFTLGGGNLYLSADERYLTETQRAYAFDPTQFGGQSVKGKIRLWNGAKQDTFQVDMDKVCWVGFTKLVKSGPPVMIVAAKDPCSNALILNDSIPADTAYVIAKAGECTVASGGVGIMVIESNIIDPSNQVNLLSSTPALRPWIEERYPELEVPNTINTSWLFPMGEIPSADRPIMPPLQMGGGSADFPADCGMRAFIESNLRNTIWSSSPCFILDDSYQVSYCTELERVKIGKKPGVPTGVADIKADWLLSADCPVKFERVNGEIHVFLPASGCAAGVGCAGSLN